jgi:hypothetical protein
MPNPGPPPLPTSKPKAPKAEARVYDVVADVATGPNLRKKDNLYQALFILVCLAIAVPTLWIISGNWIVGALGGGLIGLVAGVLLSGGFLMVYRLFKH